MKELLEFLWRLFFRREKIEWRTKNGVPYALITRFDVANIEDSTKRPPTCWYQRSESASCVTARCASDGPQNDEARRLARSASVGAVQIRGIIANILNNGLDPDPQIWIAFLTLSVLELVLGIDHVIFISSLSGKPQKAQNVRGS